MDTVPLTCLIRMGYAFLLRTCISILRHLHYSSTCQQVSTHLPGIRSIRLGLQPTNESPHLNHALQRPPLRSTQRAISSHFPGSAAPAATLYDSAARHKAVHYNQCRLCTEAGVEEMVVARMRWEEIARDQNARDLRTRQGPLHTDNASLVSSTVRNWRLIFSSIMVLATAFGVGLVAVALQLYPAAVRAAPETTLNVTAFTDTVESDWTAVYYSDSKPLLIGNDGGAEAGGLHVYDFIAETPLPKVKSLPIGRTKVVTVAHNVGGKDLAITIAAPDSIIRVYELPGFKKADEEFTLLGDWSAMCSWKSKSRNQYFYIFGKGKAVQFLIRPDDEDFEILEVRTLAQLHGCESLTKVDPNNRAAL